mmetsp:Transcript_18965/g.19233  ORF Transcript_18965/g.19233 Transcript_18965/m.19233 type:complete len:360 (+) Transcript_18965:548-1627(+)
MPNIVCRIVKQILRNRIGRKWSIMESPRELLIDVRPSSLSFMGGGYGIKQHTTNLLQLLFHGQLQADAELSSGPIIFDVIQFSSLKLELEQVTVNLFGFLSLLKKNRILHQIQQQLLFYSVNMYQRIKTAAATKMSSIRNKNKNKKRNQQERKIPKQKEPNNYIHRRFPKQFEIRIQELILSQQDLLLSSSIRNGLRHLLMQAVKDRGGVIQSKTIQITSIDILPTGKISCQGEAQTQYGSTIIPFEVRTGITVDVSGRVLLFPGLEVSLMRDIGWFLPISVFYTTLSLHVGQNTKFHTIVIDGTQKRIKIGASVTINTNNNTNNNESTIQYSAPTYSTSAKFFYDIGRGLTQLGHFSN